MGAALSVQRVSWLARPYGALPLLTRTRRCQEPTMTLAEREDFIGWLNEPDADRLAFVVMGGVFAESVDHDSNAAARRRGRRRRPAATVPAPRPHRERQRRHGHRRRRLRDRLPTTGDGPRRPSRRSRRPRPTTAASPCSPIPASPTQAIRPSCQAGGHRVFVPASPRRSRCILGIVGDRGRVATRLVLARGIKLAASLNPLRGTAQELRMIVGLADSRC